MIQLCYTHKADQLYLKLQLSGVSNFNCSANSKTHLVSYVGSLNCSQRAVDQFPKHLAPSIQRSQLLLVSLIKNYSWPKCTICRFPLDRFKISEWAVDASWVVGEPPNKNAFKFDPLRFFPEQY